MALVSAWCGFNREKGGHMKKKLLSGVIALTLMALVGSPSTAIAKEAASRLWSIAVHLEYADGSAYDYVFATGVSTSELSSFLADCGRSHRNGTVVRYHCFPIPE
jgi:hypothetical protein